MTNDDAAASACTRKGSGRAWTSLRRAAFTAGGVAEAGPATRNSARASLAVNSDRSVRMPLARHRPSSLHQLAGIHGIGEKKLAEYGAELLEEINQHIGDISNGGVSN